MNNTEMLSGYITKNPGATTADVASHLGITTEAAYRLCRKNLEGTKAGNVTTWTLPVEIVIPLETGEKRCGARADTTYTTVNVPVHPVTKCAKPEQAERMARMMKKAWRINAECRPANDGGTLVVVPRRHQRQARALVFAYTQGLKAS